KSLGIKDTWNNPAYDVRYKTTETDIQAVGVETPDVMIQNALRSVLGWKEERQFKAGKYFSNLKNGRKSINLFLSAHEPSLKANKEGTLSAAQGIAMLRDLLKLINEASAGHRYLLDVIESLERN